MGKLLAIATKRKSRAPMEEWNSVWVDGAKGIEHEERAHGLKRMITVLSKESWKEVCEEMEQSIPWTARRANLFIEGIDLYATTGKRLCIGEVVLVVTGETTPCARMNEQAEGLQLAMTSAWRGGVTCSVLKAGQLSVGDLVHIE